MTSEEYGQLIDDFELGADVGPDETLTQYIERRRREFESKADGGSIGIEVLFTEKEPRKNFFMGGPALTGTALDIFNSMKAYGFTDQDIANALKARGLYDTTPEPTAPAMPLQPNITRPNGGGKDENDTGGLNDEDFKAEAYGIGPTFARMRQGLGNIVTTFKNLPTPLNLVRRGIEFAKQKELEKQKQQEAIARDLARSIQEQNIANRTGGYQFGYNPSSDFMSGGTQGKGGFSNTEAGIGAASAAMGTFKDGGLATMFTRRR